MLLTASTVIHPLLVFHPSVHLLRSCLLLEPFPAHTNGAERSKTNPSDDGYKQPLPHSLKVWHCAAWFFLPDFTHNSQSALDCTSPHQLGTVGRHSKWVQESVQSNGKILWGKQNSPGIQTCKRTTVEFWRSWVEWTGYWYNYRHVSPTVKG